MTRLAGPCLRLLPVIVALAFTLVSALAMGCEPVNVTPAVPAPGSPESAPASPLLTPAPVHQGDVPPAASTPALLKPHRPDTPWRSGQGSAGQPTLYSVSIAGGTNIRLRGDCASIAAGGCAPDRGGAQ